MMQQTARQLTLFLVAGFVLTSPRPACGEDPADALPQKYVVDYPAVDLCCAPVRSTFYEVQRTVSTVRGRTFRHKPNGGYGLPVVDKVDGQNLLHVGADLGWHQVGEPVFAIANGVVRFSMGPDFRATDERLRPSDLSWGNFVVIEHRFGPNQYFTTIYGHLGSKRLVQTGDIVRAGQPIGEIGRQHARINGGYIPHLHFGVREGRMAEPGSNLLRLNTPAGPGYVTLVALGEETIEVQLPRGLKPPVRMQRDGRQIEIIERDGKAVAPAHLLWGLQRPDFPLVGYALKTDGWRDPVTFLREHRADTNPAPWQWKR